MYVEPELPTINVDQDQRSDDGGEDPTALETNDEREKDEPGSAGDVTPRAGSPDESVFNLDEIDEGL